MTFQKLVTISRTNISEKYELMLKLVEAGDRRYPKHAVKEVSYAEDAEDQGSSGQPSFCDDCGIDYPGDCPEHGPLTHVKDVEVEVVTRFMPTKPSPWALSISRSTIKGAQHGVFTLKPLPRKVYFGPHEGVKVENNGEGNGYNWQALQTQAEAEDRTPRRSAKTARYSWGTDPTGCAT
ncbi:histone-lysine N-methyltransferase PRDM9-like [Amblyomma americanum]